MAAGYLSKPGSKYGPCLGSCAHRDCVLSRETAETACRTCKEPIGYDRGFYDERDETKPSRPVVARVHSACADDEEAARFKAAREARAMLDGNPVPHDLQIYPPGGKP